MPATGSNHFKSIFITTFSNLHSIEKDRRQPLAIWRLSSPQATGNNLDDEDYVEEEQWPQVFFLRVWCLTYLALAFVFVKWAGAWGFNSEALKLHPGWTRNLSTSQRVGKKMPILQARISIEVIMNTFLDRSWYNMIPILYDDFNISQETARNNQINILMYMTQFMRRS